MTSRFETTSNPNKARMASISDADNTFNLGMSQFSQIHVNQYSW